MSGIPEEILASSVSINGREPLVIRIECDDYATRDTLFDWLSEGPADTPANPIESLHREVNRMIAQLTHRFKRGGGKVSIYVRNTKIEDETGNFFMTNDEQDAILPSLQKFFETNRIKAE